MRLSPAENAGDMAVYPPAGVSGVKVRPSSLDTRRACGPPTKMRLSAGYEGGSHTIPPSILQQATEVIQ